ncbi:DUF1700 domain-containing protein [Lactiplantibacillus garii]|uniref:DUF1700 domain-containing protein n=1 Tax=Lactiplantibacillus garii TaxID=2306423 RepID=A0A3R8LJ66_9LACO|nr:DUF1700 domain-containing protein [Lactiplantibacillus garii]RRK09920.1 DUF1700 domain-containing protein [Lactiplantibacillus garii]
MNNYLDKFNALLVQLKDTEREEVVEFYREYLLDAQIQEYDECVAELGTPKQLARKVLADYSIKFNEDLNGNTSKTQQSRAGIRTIWWVVLALISTPITIPALLVIALALVVIAALAFAAVATVAALIFAATMLAISMLVAGVGVIGQSVWVACFYIGAGLTVLGGELLVAPIVIWFVNLIIQGISILVQRLYHRFVKKNRAERGGRHHAKNR